jgi:hypothetical protein
VVPASQFVCSCRGDCSVVQLARRRLLAYLYRFFCSSSILRQQQVHSVVPESLGLPRSHIVAGASLHLFAILRSGNVSSSPSSASGTLVVFFRCHHSCKLVACLLDDGFPILSMLHPSVVSWDSSFVAPVSTSMAVKPIGSIYCWC